MKNVHDIKIYSAKKNAVVSATVSIQTVYSIFSKSYARKVARAYREGRLDFLYMSKKGKIKASILD